MSDLNFDLNVTSSFIKIAASTESCEMHLGSELGPSMSKEYILKCVHTFMRRVNVLCSRFKFIRSSTRYYLFNSYCMSLYGCQLWDIDSKYIELFYIAWRKSIRRIFRLHPRTHSKLLPLICKCMNINELLCARLNGFMLKTDESDNDLIIACATLAKSGSRSPVSNNFSVSRMLSWERAVVTEEDLMQSGTRKTAGTAENPAGQQTTQCDIQINVKYY